MFVDMDTYIKTKGSFSVLGEGNQRGEVIANLNDDISVLTRFSKEMKYDNFAKVVDLDES